jgi:hypothetical protein
VLYEFGQLVKSNERVRGKYELQIQVTLKPSVQITPVDTCSKVQHQLMCHDLLKGDKGQLTFSVGMGKELDVTAGNQIRVHLLHVISFSVAMVKKHDVMAGIRMAGYFVAREHQIGQI